MTTTEVLEEMQRLQRRRDRIKRHMEKMRRRLDEVTFQLLFLESTPGMFDELDEGEG